MKNAVLKKLFLSALVFLFCFSAGATSLYWYGHTSTTFSVASNWSTSNASYVASASAPGKTDLAFYGNYSGLTNANCNLTSGIKVLGMQLVTGYTGTISANTASVIDSIGTSGLIIDAGTFTVTAATTIVNAGIFTITAGTFSVNLSTGVTVTYSIAGNFNQTGGTFSSTSTAGSTVNVNVAGDMISSAGTFTCGNSTFKLTKGGGSATLTGSPTFFNLTFTPASAVTWSVGSSPTVNNTLQYTGTQTVTLNGGTLNAKGDITVAVTLPAGGGGTTNLNISGSGTQTLTGNATSGSGILPKITIACNTLHISGSPSVGGDWVYTSGTVDANFSSSNSTVVLCNTGDIDGQGTSATMHFQNIGIFFVSGTPTRKLAGNLIVDRNLGINSGITLATGVASTSAFNINVQGSWIDKGTFTQISTPSCTVTFDGTTYGAVSKTSATESFTNLTINKSSNAVILTGPVDVSGTLTLTAGRVKTTSTNVLRLTSTASVSGGSNTSYINGPMIKTGNTAFVFPLGDSTVASTPYHPLGITAPATATDAYQAQYKGIAQTSGSNKASTISSLSSCEYWTLQRTAPASGTTTITPTLNWNANCGNVNYSDMVVAAWNGTQWTDQSAGTINGASPTGSIAAGTALSFTNATTVVPVLIALKVVNRSYATLTKKLDGGYFNITGNVLYFRFDEEYKDTDAKLSYTITRLATDAGVTLMSNSSNTNVPVSYGNNAYRMDLYSAPNTPLTSGLYLLEVTNEKNETWYLRIKI